MPTPAEAAAPPAPVPDEDSAFFWDGLREHRVLVQQCEACGRRRFPALSACPACGAPGGAVVEHRARGRLYSWVVVHRAFNPAFAADVPYVVAVVELEEGVRMLGRLEDASPADGLEVEGHYVDHDGWTELRFHPAEAAPT